MFLCSDELFVVQKGKGGGSSNLLALPATIRTRKRVRALMNLSRSSWAIILRGPTASRCAQLCRIAFTRRCSAQSHPGGGDDRVSGTDADRHDDISHNGSSGFSGNADSAEPADLDAAADRYI